MGECPTEPAPGERAAEVKAVGQPRAEAQAQEPANAARSVVRWLRGMERGNAAQWTAAVAAIVTVWIAYEGLQNAQDYFQVKRLQEDNARLDLEKRASEKQLGELNNAIADARARTWKFACQILTARVVEPLSIQAASEIQLFDLHRKAQSVGATPQDVGPGEPGFSSGLLPGVPPKQQTVPKLIEFTLSQVNWSFLPGTDAERFLNRVRGFVREHQAELDIPLLITIQEQATSDQARIALDERSSAITRAHELMQRFGTESENVKPP